MSKLSKACPACKSRNIAEIFYGYPAQYSDDKFRRDIEEGRIVLAGCCVPSDAPGQMCHDCGHEWGTADV